MSEVDEPMTDLVRAEAVEWFIANREGLDARQEAAFIRWLRSSSLHVQEYLGMALTARDLSVAAAASSASIETLLERARDATDELLPFPARPSREAPAVARPAAALPAGARPVDARPRAPAWRLGALAAAVAGLLAVGLAWLAQDHHVEVPGLQVVAGEHYETRHGQRVARHLHDGSTLHLNTDTAVTVDLAERARRVVIERGQATFEVAHDPLRPFRVVTPQAEIVALGTNFDVYMRPDATVITVVAGRVSVVPGRAQQAREAGQRTPALVVNAGEQLRLANGTWPGALGNVDAWQATAWLRGRISFTQQPLGAVAAEFNRYAPAPVLIETPALRALPVSGTVAVDDPRAFMAFLRSLERVHVEVTPAGTRVWQ